MDSPCLDTRAWNLSLRGAAALATVVSSACGPVVTPEGGTDSDTDPTTGGCIDTSECPSGYYCANAVCIPYYDYECLAAGSGGCCGSDCYYYECYTDVDCGRGAICSGEHECIPITSLSECEAALTVELLELPQTEEPFVSLAFVDTDGPGDSLVVGRAGMAELHAGPGEAPLSLPVPPGASVRDAVAGDLDGDGDADLVLSTLEGHLVTLASDGSGGFVLAADQDVATTYQDLTALSWDGDGALDLAGVGIGVDGSSAAMVHIGDGAGGFMASSMLLPDAVSLAGLDYDADPYDDVVVQGPQTGQIFAGSPTGDGTADVTLMGYPPNGTRTLLAGHIDSVSPDDIVGYAPQSVGIELVAWPNAGGAPQYYQLGNGGARAELGDFDGDGSSDLVVGNDELITYVRGLASGPLLLACHSSYPTNAPLRAMAMGDLDGNGRADVAFEANGPVIVLLSQ